MRLSHAFIAAQFGLASIFYASGAGTGEADLGQGLRETSVSLTRLGDDAATAKAAETLIRAHQQAVEDIQNGEIPRYYLLTR